MNWELSCFMRTDRPTDRRRNMTKLIVAFRNFTNAPNKNEMTAIRESSCDGSNCSSRTCALNEFLFHTVRSTCKGSSRLYKRRSWYGIQVWRKINLAPRITTFCTSPFSTAARSCEGRLGHSLASQVCRVRSWGTLWHISLYYKEALVYRKQNFIDIDVI